MTRDVTGPARPRLVSVVDQRAGYDDRAREIVAAAGADGWDVVLVSLVAAGAAVTVDSGGVPLTRVPLPAGLGAPGAVRRRAALDATAALEARRAELAAGDPRRLAVAVRVRLVRRRARAGERDDAAAAAEDLLRRAAAALAPVVAAAQPDLVLAHGGTVLRGALLGAQRARDGGQGVLVGYDPVPRGAQGEGEAALGAAVRREESAAGPAVAAVLAGDPASCAARLRGLAGTTAPEPPGPATAATAGAAGAAQVRLGVGPANFAGQGWAWARAAERHLPGVRATSWALEQPVFDFPADLRVSRAQTEDLEGQLVLLRQALGFTHLLDESLRPAFGLLNGSVLAGDVPALKRAGVALAVLCHGTEIRSPQRHLERYPDTSPFGDPEWEALGAIAAAAARNGAWLAAFGGPVFVSTPDLLDDVPWATWLPVVVAESDFAPGPPVLERAVPVVVHAPSSPRFKGTALLEPVLHGLQEEGLITYVGHRDLPPAQVPEAIRAADIVVDHVVIGNYGVLACQAMAAGRVVLGHVHERVRRRVPAEVPVVEATAGTLEAVVRDLLADRASAQAVAASGPGFVREVHDGRLSAQALARFLGRGG